MPANATAAIVSQVAGDVVPIPSTFFTDAKGQIVPARLGEAIREAGHVRTGLDGRLWRYESGVYKPDGDQFVRSQIRQLLEDAFRRRVVDEVVTYLRSYEPTVTNDTQPQNLNLRNGLLNLKTRKLNTHSPQIVSTVQLPVEWNPRASCPVIDEFFRSSLNTDSLEFIWEVFGYAMYAGNPFRKAVLVLGPGGNGKSVLLALIEALLDSANCSHVPLQSLGENRFAAASLFGKLANICGDLDARAIKRTDLFKQITGGDPIFAEHKNKNPFSFTSMALPIFSANEAPISSDQSEAWFDRWLIVPMERRFEGTSDEDPDLRDKLMTPTELEGLLVHAVDGLRRLLARGHFELPPSVESANSRYRDTLDSARGFVTDVCVIDSEVWTPRSTLYRGYRKWCGDFGRLSVSAERFNDHLRKSYAMQVAEKIRRGDRGWQGIGLTDLGHKDGL